jgi:hypothetical protein
MMRVEVGKFLGPDVPADKIQRALDEIGADGWELVSVVDTNMHRGASDELLFFFKRPAAT